MPSRARRGRATRSFGRLATILLSCFAALAFAAPAARATGPTFYVDESTDFTGNGCQNADLNDVTSSLRSSLVDNGWTGSRFTNSLAWPHDFIEQTFAGQGGLDNVFGDTKTLAVYAGHGNRALLQFGFQRNGRCTITLDGNARLGALAGDDAAYAMWVTSCTVNTDSLSRHFDQQIRQTFGYHNSPPVKDDQPSDFFEETDDLDNAHAWIEEMEDRPGWFTGDNSPITLTFGVDASHCLFVRDNARLRDRVLLADALQPHHNFCFIMFDHGASGC